MMEAMHTESGQGRPELSHCQQCTKTFASDKDLSIHVNMKHGCKPTTE